MTSEVTYCTACKKEVHVRVSAAPRQEGHANVDASPEMVCLDFGHECPNGLCPRFGVPAIVMAVRLARSGERADWQRVTGVCEACERTADLQVLNDELAFCPLCRSTVRLLTVDVGGDRFVASPGRRRGGG